MYKEDFQKNPYAALIFDCRLKIPALFDSILLKANSILPFCVVFKKAKHKKSDRNLLTQLHNTYLLVLNSNSVAGNCLAY